MLSRLSNHLLASPGQALELLRTSDRPAGAAARSVGATGHFRLATLARIDSAGSRRSQPVEGTGTASRWTR